MSYSIRRTVLLGSLAMGMAWMIAGCGGDANVPAEKPPAATPSPSPTVVILDEEERPPVIISGGSIDLWVPFSDNRGEWKQVTPNDNNKWYHEYKSKSGKGWPLTYFKLNIVNGKKKDDADCANPDVVWKIKPDTYLNISTGPKRDVILSVVEIGTTEKKRVLQAEFKGLFVGQKTEEFAKFWLRDAGPGPSEVTFTYVRDDGSSQQLKCELGGQAVMTLMQFDVDPMKKK